MITYKGIGGISLDLPERDTPPEFVRIANNVTASHGKYAAVYGFQTIETLPEPIYHMQPLSDSRWEVFLLLADTKAYSWDGNEVNDITEAGEDLSALVDDEKYSSDRLNGMGIFAQKNDWPRAYGDPANAQEKIQYLPWASEQTWKDANLKTGIIRNYKNFIITLGEISSTAEDPRKVRWSASVTDTGVLPYWEPLPENDAGFVTLADLETEIMDGRQLGDHFIIYSKVSAYLMQYVGGNSVMRFQRLNTLPGVMRKNLIMPYETSHFVVGQTDIYTHQTNMPISLVDKRLRKEIYGAMQNQSRVVDGVEKSVESTIFLVKNWQYQEIWLCVGDDLGATTAYAWSWKSNTWTTRPIEPSYYGTSGVTPVDHITWGTMRYPTWESIPGTWASLGDKDEKLPEMVFSTAAETLLQREVGVIEAGATCGGCRIERHGLPIGEYEDHYTVLTVYPQIVGAKATIQVGTQYFEGGPIDWSAKQLFDPTTDKKVDVRGDNLTGSLFCFAIYNEEPRLFEYTGIAIDVRPAGED